MWLALLLSGGPGGLQYWLSQQQASGGSHAVAAARCGLQSAAARKGRTQEAAELDNGNAHALMLRALVLFSCHMISNHSNLPSLQSREQKALHCVSHAHVELLPQMMLDSSTSQPRVWHT
jgi:hypothetical protein